MGTIDYDEVVRELKSMIELFAKQRVPDHVKEVVGDADKFLEATKELLNRWTTRFAKGVLTANEFESLVRGKKDLAEMSLLKQTGMAASQVDEIRSGIIDLIVKTVVGTVLARRDTGAIPLQGFAKIIAGNQPAPDYVQQVVFAMHPAGPEQDKEFNDLVSEIVERAKNFSSNEAFWKKLLGLIERAQLAAYDQQWIDAQQSVTQAGVLVNRAIGSESLRKTRVRLVFAPFAWFLLLLLLDRLVSWLPTVGLTSYQIPAEYFRYLWMGMIGGTTIVWWGVVKHAKDLTFDSSFIIWYFLKPALGAVMGVVVVLVVQAGFVTLNASAPISNPTPLLVIAFIGGFSERFFINMIDKVVSAVLGGEQEPKERPPLPAKSLPRVAAPNAGYPEAERQ
jgi:hypothetical protein